MAHSVRWRRSRCSSSTLMTSRRTNNCSHLRRWLGGKINMSNAKVFWFTVTSMCFRLQWSLLHAWSVGGRAGLRHVDKPSSERHCVHALRPRLCHWRREPAIWRRWWLDRLCELSKTTIEFRECTCNKCYVYFSQQPNPSPWQPRLPIGRFSAKLSEMTRGLTLLLCQQRLVTNLHPICQK